MQIISSSNARICQGASTLFGPHTLSAYIQEFKKLASALISGSTVEPGPQPLNLLDNQMSFLPPVVVDETPIGVSFGDVSSDVPKNSTYKRGDTVSVSFWSACPRNDLMTEATFALVEFLQGKDTWVPAYDDDDFCLRSKSSRPFKLSARSTATMEWRIPQVAVLVCTEYDISVLPRDYLDQSLTLQVHPLHL
ncbi:hypothetical protein L6164_029930 [Bauhinia variegata]|uniref:Uncharacterized protein n=2 Tax=Bauhinia variegata TaxID=167791 RepID=A0ACB9LC26_BAUVA|nr:hypothetical protein L6164_029930 [Bauhinia variegata]